MFYLTWTKKAILNVIVKSNLKLRTNETILIWPLQQDPLRESYAVALSLARGLDWEFYRRFLIWHVSHAPWLEEVGTSRDNLCLRDEMTFAEDSFVLPNKTDHCNVVHL